MQPTTDAPQRPFLVVHLGVVALNLGLSMIHPVYGPWARSLGLSEAQAGAVVTAAALGIASSSPLMGRLSDRLGRRRVMALGLLCSGAGYLAFATVGLLAPAWGLGGLALVLAWALTRGFAGLGFSATQASSQAYVADLSPPEARGGAMAMLGAMGGLGMILGPPLGGLVAGWHLGAPVFLAGLMALLGALVVGLALPSSGQHRHEEARRLPWQDPRLLPLLPLGFLATITVGSLQICAGFLVQDRLHLGAQAAAQWVGLAMLVSGLGMLLAQLGVVKALAWPPARLLRWGLPLAALGFALLALPGPFVQLAAACLLAGFGLGMLFPGLQAAASLAVGPQEQGAAAGLLGAAQASGYMLGPALGGWLYGLQPTWPFALSAGLLALAALGAHLHPSLGTQAAEATNNPQGGAPRPTDPAEAPTKA